MDSKNGNPENQDQLDLEFSHMEPITPKKPLESKRSFSDKVFGFVGSLGKKETTDVVNNTVRQKPIVAPNYARTQSSEPAGQNIVQPSNGEFEPAAEVNAASDMPKDAPMTANPAAQTQSAAYTNSGHNTQAENTMNNEHNENQSVSPETDNPAEATGQNESVRSEPTAATASSWKKPETWPILQRLPEKHRRIVVALLAVVLLLLFFLWLKPDSTTVESYQPEAGNNLPIEFQPLDQSAAAEQAQSAPADNAVQNDAEGTTQTVEINGVATETVPQQSNLNPTQQLAEGVQNTVLPPPPQSEQAPTATQPQPAPQPVQPAPQQAQSAPAAPRPAEPSHVRPAERAVEKPKIAERSAETKAAPKPAVTPAEKAKPAIVDAKPAQRSGRAAIVEARSAAQAAGTTATAPAASGAKTLTIEKGKTLFQVFRDNGLDIRDANAMTKASGAGNVLSSFKPGDKVQVSTSGGRVTEMRLPNGSRFVRQGDGSYNYK